MLNLNKKETRTWCDSFLQFVSNCFPVFGKQKCNAQEILTNKSPQKKAPVVKKKREVVEKKVAIIKQETKKDKKESTRVFASDFKIGQKFKREFQGVEYTVVVEKVAGRKEFVYQGQAYKSLSVIARTITGTRWNGPLFFGLRK